MRYTWTTAKHGEAIAGGRLLRYLAALMQKLAKHSQNQAGIFNSCRPKRDKFNAKFSAHEFSHSGFYQAPASHHAKCVSFPLFHP